jgi:hypothetical protein
MTDQEKRVRIAEALGLEVLGDGSLSPNGIIMVRKSRMHRRKELTDWRVQTDWLRDLNAIAEADKAVLTYEQQPVFLAVLKRILMTSAGVSDWDVLHASPAQRADALLKVLDATQTPPRP